MTNYGDQYNLYTLFGYNTFVWIQQGCLANRERFCLSWGLTALPISIPDMSNHLQEKASEKKNGK